jgi:poly-beta-hydroxyalkanoate depolymerase
MNELLKKLREQANEKFNCPYNGRYTVFNEEKFAELIVRECAEFANEHNSEEEGVTLGVGKAIKQHFGVE